MSTGSVASDAEDSNPCQRRTADDDGGHRPGRRRRRTDDDDDEEEFGAGEEELGRQAEDAPGRAAQARLLPAAASQRESRQCQRNAANARERARMRVLSKGFTRLKTSLPWVPADTKLSKLDTLRLASSYISHLRQLLRDERFEHSFVHPVNLTWPFVMSGRLEDQEDNSMSSAGRTLCGASA